MKDRCPTCGRTRTRTSEQNRRYWALLNDISEKWKPEGQQYAPDTWHEYMKQKFLGKKDILLPNGKVIQITQSTAALDVSEFTDYMTQVEALVAGKGIQLDE